MSNTFINNKNKNHFEFLNLFQEFLSYNSEQSLRKANTMKIFTIRLCDRLFSATIILSLKEN
jgi:hypothetical protein